MQIITLFETLVIFFVTLYLLEHYSAKDVKLYVKILVFIPWFGTFLQIVLVPLDVFYTMKIREANALGQGPSEYQDAYNTMTFIWEIVYWATFGFTWVILPVLQEYVDAGDFTPKERIKKSIKVNLIIYGAMAALGVLFVGYMAISGKAGFHGIIEFFITFANCFGIFLIVICLGFGLVHIPKRLFQQTDKEVNLRFYHYQASVVDEQKGNSHFELEELIKLVHLLSQRPNISIEHKTLLSQILRGVPENTVEAAIQGMSQTNYIIAKDYGPLNHNKIVALNKQVKKKVLELRRIDNKWEITLHHAFFLEDIMESKHSIDWRIRSAFYIERKGKCGRLMDSLEWVWYVKLEQIFYFVLGIAFVIFSIGVFLAETFTFDNSDFFNMLSFLESGNGFTKSQIFCLIPLCYISLCVYSALFNMKLAGLYGLYPHHQTDAASLVFASINFSRVSSPMVFNFLQMLKLKGTAFNQVMGEVDFAFSFTTYFPLFLIFLIFCNAFDIYGRILGWLGLNSFKFDEEFTDERIEEGKKLVYRARNNKERSVLTLNTTNFKHYQTYSARKGKLADYYSFDMESRGNSGRYNSMSTNYSTQGSYSVKKSDVSEKTALKALEKKSIKKVKDGQ